MAHTTENANLVWQRASIASETLGVPKHIRDALRQLKEFLASVKSNPDLKFTAIDATAAASADVVVSDTANTALIALVLKKSTGTTAGFPSISDHASAVQAAKTVILGSGVNPSKFLFYISPKGFKHATGMTYQSVTAYNGTTANAAADQCNGFAISIAAELT